MLCFCCTTKCFSYMYTYIPSLLSISPSSSHSSRSTQITERAPCVILQLPTGYLLCPWQCVYMGFPGSSAGKESVCNAGDPCLTPGSQRYPGEGIGYSLQYSWASLVAQLVKNLLAMWETWIPGLGRYCGKRNGYPLLLGDFHGQRSLAGYNPWGCKELDTTSD